MLKSLLQHFTNTGLKFTGSCPHQNQHLVSDPCIGKDLSPRSHSPAARKNKLKCLHKVLENYSEHDNHKDGRAELISKHSCTGK